ncbi:MAG: septum formation initiator family protein [Gammaproteobacteria bacterium]|nr:septum formation initiator family protein [Gammaproteobacteria bacterium]
MRQIIIPVLIVLLIMLQHRLLIGNGGLLSIYRFQQQIDLLTEQLAEIEAGNQQLSSRVVQLRQSQAAIESLARYDLGMIGNDEVFFVFDKH